MNDTAKTLVGKLKAMNKAEAWALESFRVWLLESS